MQLNRRFVVVVSISLVWAAVVSGLFYRLARAGGTRAGAETEKQMVVAARALPAGTLIDRESLKLRAAPESMVPPGAFTKLDDVLDRPVISPIEADEPVVEARLAAKGSGIGLAPLIPVGMRAIAVRVNDVVGVAGFVLPGMRVDVLVTGHPLNQSDSVTRTVLQNIPVLSAGQTTQPDGKSQTIIAPVVTLLVSPQEAEALTLANNEGKIQLVLRNSGDRRVAATRGSQMHEIFGSVPSTAATGEEPVPRARPASAGGTPAHPAVAAPAADTPGRTGGHPTAARPEVDQMVVIRGAVKTLEVFPIETLPKETLPKETLPKETLPKQTSPREISPRENGSKEIAQ